METADAKEEISGSASSLPPDGGGEASLEATRRELNQSKVKHREELYWLRLELDTSRREKEAVENRMAALFRDMQEMQGTAQTSRRSPLVLDADYVSGLHGTMEKYERMLRIMNNQISLVRSSSDSVVQNLKEEISDLMDEKCKVEVELMNNIALLQTRLRMERPQQRGPPPPPPPPPPPSPPHNDNDDSTEARDGGVSSKPDDNETKQLKAELEKLKKENYELSVALEEEKNSHSDKQTRWKIERARLSNQVDALQKDIVVLRSSAEAVQRMDKMSDDREETLQTLERVSLLWDRADASVHNLESVIMELRPGNENMNDNQEQLLSTLETASLVHGQVKVSLMLIELKLRNNLACLKNDEVPLGSMAFGETSVEDKVKEIQDDAMAAIHQIESALDMHSKKLNEQAAEESKVVKETLQSKVKDLTLMKSRQAQLEAEIQKMQNEEENGRPPSPVNPEGGGSIGAGNDLFVSRKVMERLQDEVLSVVQRVKEKNEIIGRLKANVEEHKARERTLMEELKRHMKRNQGERGRQLAEQQRQPTLENKARELEEGYEKSCDSDAEYEETTVVEEEEEEEEIIVEEVVVEDASPD